MFHSRQRASRQRERWLCASVKKLADSIDANFEMLIAATVPPIPSSPPLGADGAPQLDEDGNPPPPPSSRPAEADASDVRRFKLRGDDVWDSESDSGGGDIGSNPFDPMTID